MALREALRVLAVKVLVVARRKAGTFVRPRAEWNYRHSDVLEWRLETDERVAVLDQLRQMVEPQRVGRGRFGVPPGHHRRFRKRALHVAWRRRRVSIARQLPHGCE